MKELEKYPKVKEAFEKWLCKLDYEVMVDGIYFEPTLPYYFYQFPFSMQWGVWVDFCDSKGIEFSIHARWNPPYKYGYDYKNHGKSFFPIGMPNKFERRTESRQEAFKQSLTILNDKI